MYMDATLQSSDPNIQSMGHLITRQTQLINLLSDNLLYLTRVEEGRALLIRDSDHLGTLRITVTLDTNPEICTIYTYVCYP